MAWLGGFSRRIEIIIDKDKIGEDIENFPIPIYLSASSGQNNYDASSVFDELTISGSSYTSRKKIAITTSDEETQCYVEIERWDHTNEEAWLHVKIPTIVSGTDTNVYFYYDKDQSDNDSYVGDVGSSSGQTVWDSNFKAVYHLGEDPTGGSGCIKDSTSNINHGTPGGSMTTGDLVDGQFGKALDFDGGDDNINCGNSSTLVGFSAATLEVVVNMETKADYEKILDFASTAASNTNRKYRMYLDSSVDQKLTCAWFDDSDTVIGYNKTTNPFSTGSFIHVVGVYDGTTNTDALSLYQNGSLDVVNAGNGNSINSSTVGVLYIGRDSYNTTMDLDGVVDEVRISSTDRTAAWINATYEGLWDNLVTYNTSVFVCSGTVQVDSVFTDGIDVRLYRRGDGELMGETTTISGGLFEIDSYYHEDHYIVALYTTSGTNALIYDYISP